MTVEDKYHGQIQSYLDVIKEKSAEFELKCDKLRVETEQKIASLNQSDSNFNQQSINIKVEMKKTLQSMLDDFESGLRSKFINNLEALEEIYHQTEIIKLDNLEKDLSVAYQQ